MTKRNRPEHDHERYQLCPFYSGLGIDVYPSSARVWAKGIRPGIADLICFWPKLELHFFHETKLSPNRQTRDQYEFELSCIATNVPYILGGIDEAMDFAVLLEIAERVGPTIRVKPRAEWPTGGYEEIAAEWARSNYRQQAFLRYGYRRAA